MPYADSIPIRPEMYNGSEMIGKRPEMVRKGFEMAHNDLEITRKAPEIVCRPREITRMCSEIVQSGREYARIDSPKVHRDSPKRRTGSDTGTARQRT